MMSIKPPCSKCELRDNFNGLFTCNGCRQHFCSNHIIDHTNELRNRFEQIVNEYNFVKDIFDGYKQKFSDSHWKLIDEFGKELNEIKDQIDQYQKTSNYSEQELDQWMQKLNKLKIQFTKINESPSFIAKLAQFLCSKGFRVFLALILFIVSAYYYAVTLKPLFSNLSFTDVDGPIELSDGQHLAKHIGPDSVLGSVRINRIYSKDVHHVRLSFEQISSSSKIFIGVTSEQSKSSPYGWFIGEKEVIYQNPEEYRIFQILRRFWSSLISNQPRHYFHRAVKSGDILEIELDCINTKITLKNHRTSQKYKLDINLEQSPLPWQIILHFDRHGDRVRLL